MQWADHASTPHGGPLWYAAATETNLSDELAAKLMDVVEELLMLVLTRVRTLKFDPNRVVVRSMQQAVLSALNHTGLESVVSIDGCF